METELQSTFFHADELPFDVLPREYFAHWISELRNSSEDLSQYWKYYFVGRHRGYDFCRYHRHVRSERDTHWNLVLSYLEINEDIELWRKLTKLILSMKLIPRTISAIIKFGDDEIFESVSERWPTYKRSLGEIIDEILYNDDLSSIDILVEKIKVDPKYLLREIFNKEYFGKNFRDTVFHGIKIMSYFKNKYGVELK